MDQDFRKHKGSDIRIKEAIQELETLIQRCETNVSNSDSLAKLRYYEGMAVAYTTVSMKLKGEIDAIDPAVVDYLYEAADKTGASRLPQTIHSETCSFCGRSKNTAGELALGPGVSICLDCLQFAKAVVESHTKKGE
ncbi:hypothetical protein NDK47_23135 [Brevibacillus ruminantium]|uniref:ClpX-type ZB domain-containing protein n=1 Tax=Brevibacillus ruminantium TaxID=2950604 RepID=A0ABY4WCS6_9BACL|nr:ClpX C4-type zinc finger protein [Brevibacillus ruminantium]USG64985.1 hypothetical protein NDK47_23135 [Brevibacillus ruminantium]